MYIAAAPATMAPNTGACVCITPPFEVDVVDVPVASAASDEALDLIEDSAERWWMY